MLNKLSPIQVPTNCTTAEAFLRRVDLEVQAQMWLTESSNWLRIVVKGKTEHGEEIVWTLMTELTLTSKEAHDLAFIRAARTAFDYWQTLTHDNDN